MSKLSSFDELKKRLPQLEAEAIGEELRTEREARLVKVQNDFTFFCNYYLPEYFFCEAAMYQKIIYDIIQNRELTISQCLELRKLVPAKYQDTIIPTKDIRGFVDVEPRQHGKSTRMTFAFPLWLLLTGKIHFPIIIGASKDDAELQMSNIKEALENNDRIIADFGPQFNPNTGQVWKKNHIQLANGSAIMAKGKGGSMRGVRNLQYRPDLIIVDDTLKDEESDSSTIREKVCRWFSRTVLPLGTDAMIVVVNTITNDDDLPSRLLNDIKSGKKKRWIGLRFSAECPASEGDEHGRPLWPERYSWEKLKEIQKEVGSIAYAIEFLSQPLSDEDRIFKSSWIIRVKHDEIPDKLRIFGGIDPATGAHDQSGMVTIGVLKGTGKSRTIYVLSAVGKTESTSSFSKRIRETYKLYHHKRILMESVQFQAVYKDQVVKDGLVEGIALPIRGMSPGKASKTVRLMGLSSFVENGIIMFGPGTDALIDQLVGYPAAGYDDLCDALYYAVKASEKSLGSVLSSAESADVDYGTVNKLNWRRMLNL